MKFRPNLPRTKRTHLENHHGLGSVAVDEGHESGVSLGGVLSVGLPRPQDAEIEREGERERESEKGRESPSACAQWRCIHGPPMRNGIFHIIPMGCSVPTCFFLILHASCAAGAGRHALWPSTHCIRFDGSILLPLPVAPPLTPWPVFVIRGPTRNPPLVTSLHSNSMDLPCETGFIT